MGKKKQAQTDAAAPWDEAYCAIECVYTPEQAAMIARLSQDLEARLQGKRLIHSFGVAQTAIWLALKHDVDCYQAHVAGLLHDWDKRLSPEELWEKVERYRIEVPRTDELVALLHGFTAAASLEEDYPELPSEVFQAIRRHTVGACDMSALDMVIYVADMIEPSRKGSDVPRLRQICKTCSLAQTYASCMQASLLQLIESGRYIFPDAFTIWNASRSDICAL